MSQTRTSDLEIRAASVRAYRAAIAQPCLLHHAPAGQPCWVLPATFADDKQEHGQMCANRAALASLKARGR